MLARRAWRGSAKEVAGCKVDRIGRHLANEHMDPSLDPLEEVCDVVIYFCEDAEKKRQDAIKKPP